MCLAFFGWFKWWKICSLCKPQKQFYLVEPKPPAAAELLPWSNAFIKLTIVDVPTNGYVGNMKGVAGVGGGWWCDDAASDGGAVAPGVAWWWW